jgi:Protein kinase domain
VNTDEPTVDPSQYALEVLRNGEEFVLYRGKHAGSRPVLLLGPASPQPAAETLKKMAYEYSLRNELDPAWSVRPLAMSEHRGRAMLVLDDPGGETLDRLVQEPMELTQFLRLAIGLAAALGGLHTGGLIHKDVKPGNVLVDQATGQARLLGFGIASRLPRERQAPDPPEFIAGTLAYMAPEQTGRMNRSIDSRSDLYALGVTLYQMATGTLPFTAPDPMEMVHSHIARTPIPPAVRLSTVPEQVSAVIMKLLAKGAEGRYQTAAGVESDLRRCFAEWETQQFDQVQDVLEGRRPTLTGYQKNRPEFPLRLFVRCAACGVPLTASVSKGRRTKYPYYRCRKRGCYAVANTSPDKLHSKFLQWLQAVVPERDSVEAIKETIRTVWQDRRKDAEQFRSVLTRKLTDIEAKKAILVDRWLENKVSQGIYEETVARFTAEAESVRGELRGTEMENLELERVLEFAEKIILRPTRLWVESSLDQRQRLQSTLFPGGIEYDGEEFGTASTPLFFRLLTPDPDDDWGMASPTGFEPVLSP